MQTSPSGLHRLHSYVSPHERTHKEAIAFSHSGGEANSDEHSRLNSFLCISFLEKLLQCNGNQEAMKVSQDRQKPEKGATVFPSPFSLFSLTLSFLGGGGEAAAVLPLWVRRGGQRASGLSPKVLCSITRLVPSRVPGAGPGTVSP